MANNRLFLRCRRCDDNVTIARYSVGGSEWEPARYPDETYAEWLKTHTNCGDDGRLSVELASEGADWTLIP